MSEEENKNTGKRADLNEEQKQEMTQKKLEYELDEMWVCEMQGKLNLKLAKLLIENGNLNDTDEYRARFLHYAVACEKPSFIKYLVEHGADVNAATIDGRTVLHWAIRYDGSLKLIKYLVEQGADVKAVDRYGKRIIDYALYHENIDVYDYLKAKLDKELFEAIQNLKTLDYIKHLVEKGADPTAATADGRTVLHWAVIYDGSLELIKYLVEQGADVKAVDDRGRTVLHYAVVLNNNLDVIKFLVEQGAEVKAVDKYGETVLTWAVECENNLDVIKFLEEHTENKEEVK